MMGLPCLRKAIAADQEERNEHTWFKSQADTPIKLHPRYELAADTNTFKKDDLC